MIRCFGPPAMLLAVLTITLTAVSCGQADTVILNDLKLSDSQQQDLSAAIEKQKNAGKPFRMLFLGESVHKKPLFEMFLEASPEPSNTSIEHLVQYDTPSRSLEIFDSKIFDEANSFDQVRLKLLLSAIISRYEYIDCIFLVVSAKLSDDGTKKIHCPLPDKVMQNMVVVYNGDKRDAADLIRVEGKAGSKPAFQLFLNVKRDDADFRGIQMFPRSHSDASLLSSVVYAISSLSRIDASTKFEDDRMFSSILSVIGRYCHLSKKQLSGIVLAVLGWLWLHPSKFSFLQAGSEAPVPEEVEDVPPVPPGGGAASLSPFWALFVLLFPLLG